MRSLIRSPYRFILLALVIAFIVYVIRINQVDGGLLASLDWIFLDGVLCFFGFFFWLLFFSQFVLPVRKLSDRVRIFERLMLYIQGGHGPAFFIENGKIKQRKGENKRKGPGVIVLDSASAAVLRTDEKLTRSIGPGVVFTNDKEYLEGEKAVVDLRVQKRRIGPTLEPLSSGAALQMDEPARIEIQNRERIETRGLTRDGIEIIPKIFVYFKIDAKTGQGGTEYGYNPFAVQKAIIGRNIDANLPPDTPDRVRDWRWIPTYLAADIWKESLSRFTLEELFNSRPQQPSALNTILHMIEERLTQEDVNEYDPFGRPTGQQTSSHEFSLLKNRGIRVLRVEIRDLQMPDSVEKHLVQRWRGSWLSQAKREGEAIDTLRAYIAEETTGQALESFYLETTRPLADLPPGQPQPLRALFSRLIQSVRTLIGRHPPMRQNLTQENEQLRELVEWTTNGQEGT